MLKYTVVKIGFYCFSTKPNNAHLSGRIHTFMIYDLQKASLWKRISAYLFDGIMLCILAVGLAFIIAGLLQVDTHAQAFTDYYTAFEAKYGVDFDVALEDYEAMTQEDQKLLDDAYVALTEDPQANQLYAVLTNLVLLTTTLGILAAFLMLEFLVPLILKNGQTMGKRVFGICVIRTDGVRISPLLLLIRTLLGKFTLETMIPVYLIMMILFSDIGLLGTALVLGIAALQLILLTTTQNKSTIHDLLAKTVVVDMHSQLIFNTPQDAMAYRSRHHAE